MVRGPGRLKAPAVSAQLSATQAFVHELKCVYHLSTACPGALPTAVLQMYEVQAFDY